jgi:DNA-binding CsgD family transcriptional regulator
LFASGKTYKEVAAECGIAPETVNPMLKAAARNLGLGGRIARSGLVEALEWS